MRPADPYHAVGESLQADVMRFMAIIAFCLIAILALVRSVEPPQASSEPDKVADEVAPLPAFEPVAEAPALAAPERIPQPVAEQIAEQIGEQIAEPIAKPIPRRMPAPIPQRPVVEAPVSVQPVPARPDGSAASRQGLSLRFASDQDFLRLVSRGAIQVFAFNDHDVLSLQSDFSFQPATTPGRVHELLPETIPALMSGALARSHGDGRYRWGIAMPTRMAQQIRDYVDGGASGELVIDRFGEVRHHDV